MNTPAFHGRTDAELKRILAPACVECGSRYPVAADPAQCSPLELKSIELLDQDIRDALIRFRGLDKTGRHFICGGCAYLMSED